MITIRVVYRAPASVNGFICRYIIARASQHLKDSLVSTHIVCPLVNIEACAIGIKIQRVKSIISR